MRRIRGFTLVELLVVMAVIAVLIALLLPAVQQAREAARLVQCRNNLKQMGLALHNYASIHGLFPPSSTSQIDFGVWSPQPTQYHLHSWTSLLLPLMEQTNLEAKINYNVSALDPLNATVAATIIPTYRCPTYSGPSYSRSPMYLALGGKYAIRNYAAMGGTTVGKFYQHPDGAFFARSSTRIEEITDGSSTTIFIVETREPDAMVWIDGGTAAVTAHAYNEANPPDYSYPQVGINDTPYFNVINNQGIDSLYGPSSQHPAGVAHLFGDGSVRVLSESISTPLYDALVTIRGGEKVERNEF